MTGTKLTKRVRLDRPALRRLKKKWAGFLADAVAEGDRKQAENWQEAINAADAIIERQRRNQTGRQPEHMAKMRAAKKPRARRDS